TTKILALTDKRGRMTENLPLKFICLPYHVVLYYRQFIQYFFLYLPVWKIPVHEQDKPFGMVALHQMHHFVNHDVLNAFQRLFCQLNIKPKSSGIGGATAPLGFHRADFKFRDIKTHTLAVLSCEII